MISPDPDSFIYKKYHPPLTSAHPRIVEVSLRVQFRNEQFFRRARPHEGLRRDVFNVRRSQEAAENAVRRKNGHLWMDTNYC